MSAFGGIYIDPDTVSHVSNRLLQIADEIENLDRSVAALVQPVITEISRWASSNYQAGSLAWSLEGELRQFKYLGSDLLLPEVRIAALGLAQVADEARNMIAQLQQQATTFSDPEERHGFWDYVGAFFGVYTAKKGLDQLVERATEKEIAEEIASVADYLAQEWADLDPVVEHMLSNVAEAAVLKAEELAKREPIKPGEALFDAIGIVLDIMTDPDKNTARKIFADTTGGIIQVGLAWAAPEVMLPAALISGLTQLGSLGGEALQSEISSHFAPTEEIRAELEETEKSFHDIADQANFNKPFDDVGRMLFDLGTGSFSEGANDLVNTFTDTLTLGQAPLQFAVHALPAAVDDALAIGDTAFQNLPLPDPVKNAANWATGTTMHLMDAGTNLVSHVVGWL